MSFYLSLSTQLLGKTACRNFLRQHSFVRIFSSSFREGKGAIVTPAGLFLKNRLKVVLLQIYNKNLTPK